MKSFKVFFLFIFCVFFLGACKETQPVDLSADADFISKLDNYLYAYNEFAQSIFENKTKIQKILSVSQTPEATYEERIYDVLASDFEMESIISELNAKSEALKEYVNDEEFEELVVARFIQYTVTKVV